MKHHMPQVKDAISFNINTQLARGIMAFRQGQGLTPSMSDAGTGELYRARSQAVIRDRLSDDQYTDYTHIRDMARDAISLIHVGTMDAAAQKFAEAKAELTVRQPQTETHLLCQAWIDQGLAYLETRRGHWGTACHRLNSAIAADQQLEEDFGYDIFHIGRVHIVHLRVRLLAAEGHYEDAIVLAQQIAAYVLGQSDTLPFGNGWTAEKARSVPTDLQHAMLIRISSEVGTILASVPADVANTLFEKFPSWTLYAKHPILSEIYDWGQVKKDYLSGEVESFLRRAADVLMLGPRETSLWYSVALDFCRVCAVLRPKQTRNFLNDAAEAAQKWCDISVAICPPQLRLALQALAPSPAHTNAQQDLATPYVASRPQRQFQLYSVGLPRTGTSSLANIFANFRSVNEFQEKETMEIVTAHRFGRISTQDFHAFLDNRDINGHLEMDAASFNHFYLDYLIHRYPHAGFIFTVRDPYGWTNSYMKLLLRWKQIFGETPPQWTNDYGRMIFNDFQWATFQSEETLSQNIQATAEQFIIHWGEANRRILGLLPPDRSLIINTDELSHSLGHIAEFAQISPSTLTDRHHTNIGPDRQDLMATLNPSWFADRCREHASDVIAMTDVCVNGKVL
ncbi:MAG: hypothetical protein JKY92_01835 [Magnetovibrio sp.]|nr:hypothetical protein [Magnetovibrio sp.]